MFYKLHETKAGKILAAADESLLGKKLKLKDKTEFFVNPRFYGEKKASKEWLIKTLQPPNEIISANLLGEEAVQMGLEAGIIDKDKIVLINKIPHSQSFLIF